MVLHSGKRSAYCDSVTQDEWSTGLVKVVAGEIKRWRKRRQMSAQRLSNACSELGFPIPRAVLANLENGRRDAISLPELLVIARALEVAPALLVFPIGQTDKVEFLPGTVASPWLAAQWFSGTEDLEDVVPHEDGRKWHRDGDLPIRLFLDHETVSREVLAARGRASEAHTAAESAESDREREAHRATAASADQTAQYAESTLGRVRSDMRDAGLTPPPLWPQLAHLEKGA